MELSEGERRSLGGRIRMRRQELFGTKSEAYRAAGVNAATWDRIEAGDTVREDRLVAALRALWPDAEGQWEELARGEANHNPYAYLVTDDVDSYRLSEWASAIAARVASLEAFVAQLKEEQEGGTHDDLADLDQKSGGGEVTPLRPEGTRQKAAREVDVPDKED